MAILTFLSNAAIELLVPNCVEVSGSGPVRLAETTDSWRLVMVNATDVVGTVVEVPKGMDAVDVEIPASKIEWVD